MIISRTPFRISFFGGGTDYAPWYREHGGKLLTTTFNRYCYISARYLPPFFEKRSRIVWSRIELVDRAERAVPRTKRFRDTLEADLDLLAHNERSDTAR